MMRRPGARAKRRAAEANDGGSTEAEAGVGVGADAELEIRRVTAPMALGDSGSTLPVCQAVCPPPPTVDERVGGPDALAPLATAPEVRFGLCARCAVPTSIPQSSAIGWCPIAR